MPPQPADHSWPCRYFHRLNGITRLTHQILSAIEHPEVGEGIGFQSHIPKLVQKMVGQDSAERLRRYTYQSKPRCTLHTCKATE